MPTIRATVPILIKDGPHAGETHKVTPQARYIQLGPHFYRIGKHNRATYTHTLTK